MPADRSIAVRVTASVSDLQRGMAQASSSVRGFQSDVANVVRTHQEGMTTIGAVAAGAGLAITAGLGLGVKAAVDWESAFTGVVKTVSATDAELAVLEQGLRDLAGEIPVSHQELAGIAETAGQLGIESENILAFTETIAALGVSSNLAGEEGATMLARFANITGLPEDQFENLASTIVELGNNGASTEREIAEMGLRIAGAGAQIGLSESEILGFANGLSSVGIHAEAGGTAISRVFVDIEESVRQGGDKLSEFARVAGMSSDDFVQAYEDDAAGAIVTFIEGLGDISDAGGDVFGVLEDLELGDIRVRDALLRAAGAGDDFRESIETGNEAFSENTALSEEAARRYETAASGIQDFKNAIYEAGITIGEIILPVLTPLVEGATALIEGFSDLPEPVQIAITALAGISGVLLTISGTALLLAPRILAVVDAWKAFQGIRAARAVGGIAGGMLPTPIAGPGGIGGKLGKAGKAGLFGAAVVLTGIAVKEGVDLADDIGQGNKELSEQVGDLMRAAEAGDESAAARLESTREAFIENAGWFEKNIAFWDESFVANRAFLTAAEEAQSGAAELSHEIRASGSSADEFEHHFGTAGDALDEYADSATTAAAAQREMVTAMNEALSPVSAAIGAFQRMEDAQANMEAVQANSESTAEDIAAAQFAYVESLFATEAAFQAVSPEQLETAIGGISTALGISTEKARNLLTELGLLDGKNVETVITTRQVFISEGARNAARNTLGRPREQRAEGGPVDAMTPYLVGERGPEMFVPSMPGTVLSNPQTQAAMGTTITNNIYQYWPQGERVENGTRRALSSASFLRTAS